MLILVKDLLSELPSDTEERVRKAKDRFNTRVRDTLRRETRFSFQRRTDTGSNRDESISVPISVIPGLPESLQMSDKNSIDDEHLLSILLAPFRQALTAVRDGAKRTSEKLLPVLQKEPTAAALLDGRQNSLGPAYEYADFLLNKLAAFQLTEHILSVNSDVLGVYRYRTAGDFGDPGSSIELYWGVIGLVARDLIVSVEGLTCVVLAHELGHAYTHVGTDANDNHWNTSGFTKSEHELKEWLAQYYTQLVCTRLQQELPGAFDAYKALLPHQPAAYRVHELWQDAKPEHVRLTMLEIRGTKERATFLQFTDCLAKAIQQLGH